MNKIVVSRTYQDGIETITYSDGSQVKVGAVTLGQNSELSLDWLLRRFTYLFSDGGTSSSAWTPNQKITDSVLKSITISDANELYKNQCANPVIQFVIPVRLNNDAQQDFIIHYWCPAGINWGKELSIPTPDALVAQVSQPDGSYKTANEQVFGSRFYSLGGASRKYVRGDINGDGRDDFAFAMNWEDGRLAANSMTNATEPSVLLSTFDGGYRVKRLGQRNWNHSVNC
jgi:hypothetical protein